MFTFEEKREQKFKDDIKQVNSNFHEMINSDDTKEIEVYYELILECLKDIYQYRLRIARQNKNKSV